MGECFGPGDDRARRVWAMGRGYSSCSTLGPFFCRAAGLVVVRAGQPGVLSGLGGEKRVLPIFGRVRVPAGSVLPGV